MTKQSRHFILQFLSSETIGFGLGIPVAVLYGLVLSPVFNRYGNFAESLIRNASLMGVFIVLFLAMPINLIISFRTAKFIDRFHRHETSANETTRWFKRLHNLSLNQGILVFSRILLGSVIVGFLIQNELKADLYSTLTIIMLGLHGAFLAGIVSYITILKLLRRFLMEIANSNLIPDEMVHAKKNFGVPISRRMYLFILLPLFIETLTLILVFNVIASGQYNINLMTNLVIMVIMNLLMIAILAMIFNQQLSRSIKDINTSMNGLISESGDLTRTIPTNMEDEIGYIGFLYNRICGNIRSLFRAVKVKTSDVTTRIDNIFEPLYMVVTASTSAFRDAQQIVEKTQIQKDLVGESNQVSSGMKTNIQTLDEYSVEFRDSLKLLLDNTDAMMEKLLKLKESSRNSLQTIELGIQNVSSIETSLGAIGTAVDQVKSTASEISQINSAIEEIANLTNILSMNASIEASHAGHFGHGFAVVAREIKKLANQSRDSARHTGNQIKNLLLSIENASDTSASAIEKIKNNLEVFEKIRVFYHSLTDFFEEQGQTSSMLREEVSGILQKMDQLVRLIEEQKRFVQKTAENMQGLDKASDEIHKYIDKMVGRLDQLVKNIQLSMESLDETRKMDQELLKQVNQFKIDDTPVEQKNEGMSLKN